MYRRAHWFVLGIAILSLAGFVPTYVGLFAEMRLAHHVHFWSALAWAALLVAQPWLAANGGMNLHRTLGILGVGVFTAFYATSMYTTWYMAGHAAARGGSLLLLLWFDTVAIQVALLAVVLAVIHRRNLERHQRLMVATALVFVVPGFGRTVGNFIIGPLGLPGVVFPILVFGSMVIGTAAWAWSDRFRNGVTTSVFGLTLALIVSTFAVASTDWWKTTLATYGNAADAYQPFILERDAP